MAGVLAFATAPAQALTQIFESTDAEQTFEVPAGVTSIEVAAVGGKGGDAPLTGGGATQGGDAAEVIGFISVTPGQILYIEVGSNGSDSDITAEGGFNGGGNGAGEAAARRTSEPHRGRSILKPKTHA